EWDGGKPRLLRLSPAKGGRAAGVSRTPGKKMSGSLPPVGTRLGVHAMDASDPTQPKTVHAFVPRSAAGYRVRDTWDTLGMRATRSDDTLLEGVFVPDRYIAHVVPAGAIDPFDGAA